MKHKKIYKLKILETNMIKKRAKKGQGGPSVSMLVGIVLGALVLVVAAIGWWSGADWFYGLFGLLPDEMANEISRCKLIVDANNELLDATYCQTQKNIRTASGKRNIDCEFKEIIIKTGKLNDPLICEDSRFTFCDGLRIQALEDNEEFTAEDAQKIKVNDVDCAVILNLVVTPPVSTGSCANSNPNLDCRNYNDGKNYCEGVEGCVWDDTKPDKCVSIINCNSKTTSVACTAISGCTWTPNVA